MRQYYQIGMRHELIKESFYSCDVQLEKKYVSVLYHEKGSIQYRN